MLRLRSYLGIHQVCKAPQLSRPGYDISLFKRIELKFFHLFRLMSYDFRLKSAENSSKGYLGFLLMFMKMDKLFHKYNNTVLRIFMWTIWRGD